MRIIAGAFGGRRLKSPADRRVRRTPDRVREAWFSILASQLENARVIDLFAGSGVLGLEALSRGAAWVDFVDVSTASLAAIEANLTTLDVADRAEVHRADALRFIERLEPFAYDVALADPPFGSGQAERLGAMFRACSFARVLSIEHRFDVDVGGDDTRRYGDVAITFCYGA